MKGYKQIVTRINNFNQARGWKPVAEDLAKSVVLEAAELLEHYQWDASNKSPATKSQKNNEEIALEMADVFWYLITFSRETRLDLLDAVEKKLAILEKKYPEAEFKGKHNQEAYLKHKAEYRKLKNKN